MGKTATRSDSDAMSVAAARAILGNTRGVSDTVVEEARQTIRAVHLENTGRGMCRCGSACWVRAEFGLVCERCGTLSEAARQAAERAAASQKAAQKAKEAAEAPKPREALKAVADELAGARAEEARLEAAAAHARDQLAQARVALDVAEAALPAAREKIASAAVEALLDPAAAGRKPRTTAIEAASLEMARNGLELATTAGDTIADMLSDVGYQVRRLEKRHREAALNVLSAECAPLFVARASEARNEFVMASKGLQWLERAGAPPNTLIGAELRWSWHHSPEVWNAGSQAGPDLDAALAALLRDPRAPVELS